MAHRSLLATLIAFVTLVLLAAVTTAQGTDTDITIQIAAEVVYVDDRGNVLGGTVNVGDTISGQYTYDSATPDSNPLETVGDYWHSSSPHGIMVSAGELVFQTEPDNVQFLVEIVNDHNGTDAYLLRSYENLPLPNGVMVEHISWQLDDPTATALSSEGLPTDPPNLADWDSVFGLSITGCFPDPHMPEWCDLESEFFIRAHVISASTIPLCVPIDIKPGSDPNAINLASRGVVPVAVLTTDELDVSTVDPVTVLFAGASPLRWTMKDMDTDGDMDLLVHFKILELDLDETSIEASLIGETFDGQAIQGTDSVNIVP